MKAITLIMPISSCPCQHIHDQTILIPQSDHLIYLQCLVHSILQQPAPSQNEIHGLLLQILFMMKIAEASDSVQMKSSLVEEVVKSAEEINDCCLVGMTRNTFLEVGIHWKDFDCFCLMLFIRERRTYLQIIKCVLNHTSQHDHLLSTLIRKQLHPEEERGEKEDRTAGHHLAANHMVENLTLICLRSAACPQQEN